MSYLRLGIIFILFMAGITIAQEATPEVTEEAPSEIELTVFTLPEAQISGVAPADWEEVAVGTYINPEDETNSSYLLHFASTELTLHELLEPILEAFLQEDLPEESETYTAEELEWSLYTFEYQPASDSDETLMVDVATLESDNLALAVILQSQIDDYDTLHQDVFLEAVSYFGQEIDYIFDKLGFESLIPATLADFGIDTLIPRDWESANVGSYTRGDLQVDPTTLLIQTSSDLSETEFLSLFLERLGLSDAGDGIVYESDYLDWTIYEINIDIEDTLLTWQMATAGDDNFAYLVVLFSFTEESDSLSEAIFLPVLDYTRPAD